MNYSSRKYRKVVRYIIFGDFYALYASVDVAYVLQQDFGLILKSKIPLSLFTDPRQIFGVTTCASHATDRRLMINIAAALEAFKNFKIKNIGFIGNIANHVDGLTKQIYCNPSLKILWNDVQKPLSKG